MSIAEEFGSRLQTVIARHLGPPGEISNLTRLTGGATRVTWAFDARIGDKLQPLILQQCPARQRNNDEPVERMARVVGGLDALLMQEAEQACVPAPRVRLSLEEEDGLGPGFITDRIEGETIGGRIVRSETLAAARGSMARQCGEILARIHRMDASRHSFLIEHTAAQQVSTYRDIWDRFDHPHPAIELGFRWAFEHLPAPVPLVLVHGDFRNGNFVVGADGIRAVLDWELAHVGDPMEDLGWLCMRTWRFGGEGIVGGFGRREDLFESYEQAGGMPVDPERVRFWEAFGCLKWAVMCMIKGQGYLGDRDRGGDVRSVEALAIGRRVSEPIYDFLNLVYLLG
jgi:aminoglycoside phosphotransferase (APT) family kinase protein